MYFRPLLALLLLLAACSSPRAAAPVEPPAERVGADPIFRYVNLGPLGQFELGTPFGDYARLAVPEGPNRYRLRDEAFGGAESIVVTTDNGGLVRRISFEYGDSWLEKLASYKGALGPPSEASETEVIWNDGQTEFSLSREAGAPFAARARDARLGRVAVGAVEPALLGSQGGGSDFGWLERVGSTGTARSAAGARCC